MELMKVFEPWNWFKKEDEAKQVPVQVQHPSREYPLDRLHFEMNQLFDSFFRGFPTSLSPKDFRSPWEGLMRPQVDIAENTKGYTITVEVPGVEEEDMELTLSDGTLTIRGEKQYEKEGKDKQYHRVERSYGAFQRVLSLPHDADENEVKAQFKNGVLTIAVGKTVQAKSSVKKIAINE